MDERLLPILELFPGPDRIEEKAPLFWACGVQLHFHNVPMVVFAGVRDDAARIDVDAGPIKITAEYATLRECIGHVVELGLRLRPYAEGR